MTWTCAELTPEANKWIVVAVAGAVALYFLLKPSFKKKKDPLARPPQFASLARQRSVEREMQNLLVELSDMTRQIQAQLDTRASKLEALIDRADHTITELRAMVEAAATPVPSTAIVATAIVATATPVEPPNIALPLPIDDRHRRVYDLHDQGRSAMEIAREINRPRGEVELILALRPKSA